MLCIQDIFLDTWGVMPVHTAFIPSLLCYRYRTNQDTSHSYSLSFLLMTSTVFLSWPRPQTRAHKIHSVPRLNVSESNIKSKPQESTKDKEVKGCDDKFFWIADEIHMHSSLVPKSALMFPSYGSHMNLEALNSVAEPCFSNGVYINSFLSLWQNPQPANHKKTNLHGTAILRPP